MESDAQTRQLKGKAFDSGSLVTHRPWNSTLHKAGRIYVRITDTHMDIPIWRLLVTSRCPKTSNVEPLHIKRLILGQIVQ